VKQITLTPLILTAHMSTLEFFLWQLAFAFAISYLLWWSLRRATKQNKGGLFRFCLVSVFYLICSLSSFANAFLFHKSTNSIDALQQSKSIASIGPDWGSGLVATERTRLSLTLATSVYIDTGKVTNFVDLDGRLSQFVPSERDHESRAAYLHHAMDKSDFRVFAGLAALGWLLLPLVAFGFALYYRK